MLIGVDGNEANVSQRVGVGQFAYQILNQFYQSSAPHFRIYLKSRPTLLPKQRKNWEYRLSGPSLLWTQFSLPLSLYRERFRPDVFFSPTHYAPRFCPVSSVVSVMDLAYLFFPEQFRKRDLWQLKLWTAYSLRQAAKVITISESTRRDVLKHYRLKPDQVVVAYPGYDSSSYHPGVRNEQDRIKEIKEQYGIGGDYLISIGTLQPRKNYTSLIRAFARLRLSSKAKGWSNLNLVIVGKRGWLEKPIFQLVEKLGLENRVILTGFVPKEKLPYLLGGAQVFALLSLYEGFGIPVLEAMAVGVPAVLARTSSLPEVGGKAALYVDPGNLEEIVTCLTELLTDDEKRENLSQAGFANVKRFSWSRSASTILNILKEVALAR